jgi:hypothetical protein
VEPGFSGAGLHTITLFTRSSPIFKAAPGRSFHASVARLLPMVAEVQQKNPRPFPGAGFGFFFFYATVTSRAQPSGSVARTSEGF